MSKIKETPNGPTLLSVYSYAEEMQVVLDGRAIRHLDQVDLLGRDGEHALLVDGKGWEYLADTAEWEAVRKDHEEVR